MSGDVVGDVGPQELDVQMLHRAQTTLKWLFSKV
eukprot:CAMPEP_0194752594 /NCGR_PEP_ID=MMETSP0323_2-20130528/6421_1 /TAXON_ID=2866 ORGANISM="Crypthecodinium cohnii, Strain Seligo" /NCGR_SAMPLE_ID=MMETSP0323_2 /ASSEMBLY_ACC=CAM_ASM_000346 /LENGTH=33 /DNA_ID= /DNA_START= /DNA_END= /DNA_ORIENTATION=